MPPVPSPMSLSRHEIELLAPAKTADIGIEAINHGADAVYIGGPAFGARANADNDIRDIERLITHAHRFNAKIFITLNTILRDALRGMDAGDQAAVDRMMIERDGTPDRGRIGANAIVAVFRSERGL